MDSPLLLLLFGALWVWLGLNLGKLRDRYFPLMADWLPLVIWFLLIIIPIGMLAMSTNSFRTPFRF